MPPTNSVFLVRPSNFVFNTQTALTNAFQNKPDLTEDNIQQNVKNEFENFAQTLKSQGLEVLIFDDTSDPIKPDAIFPNNWISLHADGTLVLYPMCTPNRRSERRYDIVDALKKKFSITNVIDLSQYEKQDKFLEGTGSIVFDHLYRVAYACISPRTDKELFLKLCDVLDHQPVYFHAHDKNGKEIYHTNVMMCIGDRFTVICSESISDAKERKSVLNLLSQHREVIEISFEQMNRFAGNMLALGKDLLVLSQSAFDSLTTSQKQKLEKYAKLIPLNINTIESIGGGSARCMVAEIFCESKT